MSTGLKVVLILLVLGVLACGGVLVASKAWFEANKDELAAMGIQATEDGEAFGLGVEQAGCVNEGLSRVDSCGELDPMCEAPIGIFIEACLGTAAPTPGFCDGVPAPESIVDSATWRVGTCQNLGRANDEACGRMLGSVQEYCKSL